MYYISLLIILFFSPLKSEYNSSVDAWNNILQTPELLTYFNDVFDHLGVTIEETGEKFTIHHMKTEFVFEEGIVEGAVDFIVPLELKNIENMYYLRLLPNQLFKTLCFLLIGEES